MTRIFATGDIHLGMKYTTYGDVRQRLADGRYEALNRCIETANAEECHLFVVAGDLFDRQNIAKGDIDRAFDAFSKFEGRGIILLPGNHDYYTGPGHKPWHELIAKMESRSLPVELLHEQRGYSLEHLDLELTIFPGPCTSKHSAVNTVSYIKDQIGGVSEGHTAIGVAHGSVEGKSLDSEGNYYPMSESELKSAGVDVWIIGHTHIPFPDEQSVDPWLFIPGTPEPDGFDCVHRGGAWIVEVDGSGVSGYRRISTGRYNFLDITAEISAASEIAGYLSDAGEHTLARLTLHGSLPREEIEKVGGQLAAVQQDLMYLRTDTSALEESLTAPLVEAEFTAGSLPSQLLLGLLEDGDQEAAQTAYKIIRSLQG